MALVAVMQRQAYHRRKKAKRLSPYRRLKAELANERAALVKAVDDYVELLTALGDAVDFIDRLMPGTDTLEVHGWTHEDGLRLAKIRRLAIPLPIKTPVP